MAVFKISRGVFDLSQSEQKLSPIDTTEFTFGSIQIDWTGLDAADGLLRIQGSVTGIPASEWNWIGSLANGAATMDTAADTQVWEFTVFTTRYIRLHYAANSNTTGTGNITFFGAVK
jgi:hypothetical protein